MSDIEIIKRCYACFNARNIDGVLAELSGDVAWANGMEGGHVHGHAEVRDYWTRQWAIVSPTVEPLAITRAEDGVFVVEVRQTIRDLDGNPLAGQTHGLHDKTVNHIFRVKDGKIIRFDIGDEA